MLRSNYIVDKLNESGHNVIVVDIQPAYQSYIKFDMTEFVSLLNNAGKVLVFYVSDPVGEPEDETDIYKWYLKHGLEPSKKKNLTFWDKGEGFFRHWMGEVSDEVIIETVRYLLKHRLYDTSEIDDDTMEEIMGEDYSSRLHYEDILFLGLIDPKTLKRFSGSRLCGGGFSDCLEEVRLYMEAIQAKYIIEKRFIYG